jgi:protein-disulfide isomerase
MSKLYQGLSTFTAICAGFIVAYFGVAEHNPLEAQESALKSQMAFGDQNSPIEIYLFSDWTCPACKKLEPRVASLGKAFMAQEKVYFIDYAIHPESLNFTPYHVSFMLHNKNQYFQLRDALSHIATKTTSPTETEVEQAMSQIGAKYNELDYTTVASAISYFKELGKKFKVEGTPTVVLINTETKKEKKLVGMNEITETNVFEAIQKIR